MIDILCHNFYSELPVVVSQSGASTVGAVIGVLLVAGLLIAAVVVTVVVSYTLYIKKSMLRISKYSHYYD